MARLIACASGNLTSSSTWQSVSSSFLLTDSEASTVGITTSTTTHTTQSATPGVETIDGVAIKIATRPGSSGTLTVILRNVTSSTDVTSVTVNITDLPLNGWVFIKFASPETLLAATAYALRLTASANSLITLYRSVSATTDFSRLWRTTTNAAPAAGDQIIISDEYTGAGTSNHISVDMNETATTAYGNTSYVDSLAVSGKAELNWPTTSATNAYLRVIGRTTVWDQSTWNQGTSGARIPSDSTSTFEMYSSANVDSGFWVMSGGIVNRYGNIKTSTKTVLTSSVGGYCTTSGTTVTRVFGQPFTGMSGTFRINVTNYTILSVTDADTLTLTGSAGTISTPTTYTNAGTANVIQVADTTGWEVGDTLVFPSTSITNTHYDEAVILTVDSSTQVTLTAALTYSHLGESPLQCAVANLTRNIKIFGRSSTLQGYLYYDGTSVINDSYVEFYWLGSGTSNKRGISLNITTGSYTSIGCVIRNCEVSSSCGYFTTLSTANNISITYLNTYLIHTSHITFNSAVGPNITFDNITGVRNTSGSLFIFNTTATITNIYSASPATVAITINSTTIGTVNNLIAHSCNSSVIVLQNIREGTISDVYVYQNLSGANISFTGCNNLTLDNINCIGTSSGCIGGSSSNNIIIKNSTFAGSIIQSATIGVTSGGHGYNHYFSNCSFGVATSFNRAFTVADVQVTSTFGDYYFTDCLFSSATKVGAPTAIYDNCNIVFINQDQVAGAFKRWEKYGILEKDTTTYRTASPAETLTPNVNTLTTFKLKSTETQPIAIDNGQTATVTVYVYKNGSYTGAQPRLMIKKNEQIGILSDTVLATASGGTGSWLTLSGTTPAATADGAFVCYVDCDGGFGTVTVDDWSVS